jgi:hypothetical protein
MCLIAKPVFHLCHIQILKNATDTAMLTIMHDITFTYHTSVNLCRSVYEFCIALKVGCIAYEKMIRISNFCINITHMNVYIIGLLQCPN